MAVGGGFCSGLPSASSAGLLPMSLCPTGSLLPSQVGHRGPCHAMVQPPRKKVNPISMLTCLQDPGLSPALGAAEGQTLPGCRSAQAGCEQGQRRASTHFSL